MPMPRIDVETSVISYLTARPSRDLLVAARQEATREWWESRSVKFAAFSSQLVLKEVAIQQLGYPPPIFATPEELLETLP